MTLFALADNSDDEATDYELGRYISTKKALWRMFDFHYRLCVTSVSYSFQRES